MISDFAPSFCFDARSYPENLQLFGTMLYGASSAPTRLGAKIIHPAIEQHASFRPPQCDDQSCAKGEPGP
jgi:hypothetical protein